MSDSQPLPSVERPEHYVQLPQECSSSDTLRHGPVENDAAIAESRRGGTPVFPCFTEQDQLQEDKDNAFHLRQDLRELVLKVGMDYDLGAELDDSSTDLHYWVERRHFFAKERIRIEFAIKAEESRKQNNPAKYEETPPGFPPRSLKKFAIECWEEFHTEARRVGLKLLGPSELNQSSDDPDYWRAQYVFYFNESQRIQDLAPKVEKKAWLTPTPPILLSQAEVERMAYHKDLALKNRKELHYWIRKADFELVDSDDLDESSQDPGYWGEMAAFYLNEAIRVKTRYRLMSSKDLGYILIGTNPETGERYIKERKMYGDGEPGPQATHNTFETSKPKTVARSSKVTKPRLPHKAKGSRPQASRADPASRGAVSKRSRATSPISSRLRNKTRPIQPAGPRTAR